MLGLGSSISSSAASLGGFELTNISGLTLWFKNSVGVAAAQWDDSSGNDNHATQGTGSEQGTTTGGEGGLVFDGGDFYEFSDVTATVFTAFFCVKPDDQDAAGLLGNADTTDFIKINHAGNEFRIKKDSGNTNKLHNMDPNVIDTSKQVLMVRQNTGDTISFGIDDDIDTVAVSGSTARAIVLNQLMTGSGLFSGTLLETAFYNSALSESETTLVRENIAARCGV